MPDASPAPLVAFENFEEASAAVIEALRRRMPFALWMVTRRRDDDWVVLTADDRGYGVGSGDVLRWSDSFCARMVDGAGPLVTGDAMSVQAYRDAPIAGQLQIGTYVGIPLAAPGGELFGTLCGIDPERDIVDLGEAAADVDLLGRLLATVLAADLRAVQLAREAERAAQQSRTDPETGLLNAAAWREAIAAEEHRCRRYGDSAGVVVVAAGTPPELAIAAGGVRRVARPSDVVARLDETRVGVLAIGVDELGVSVLAERVAAECALAAVDVTIGAGARRGGRDLAHALADVSDEVRLRHARR